MNKLKIKNIEFLYIREMMLKSIILSNKKISAKLHIVTKIYTNQKI